MQKIVKTILFQICKLFLLILKFAKSVIVLHLKTMQKKLFFHCNYYLNINNLKIKAFNKKFLLYIFI